MAMPKPIIVTTGCAKKCTGPNSAVRRRMPSAPPMVRPPMMAGRAAAMAPPNTKKRTTATSGTMANSARFWSVPIVPVSSLASGSMPASLMFPPLTLRRSGATDW
ncbi:hypothetical protein MAUB1S_03869 [Mycolicibacterium aubagnense]